MANETNLIISNSQIFISGNDINKIEMKLRQIDLKETQLYRLYLKIYLDLFRQYKINNGLNDSIDTLINRNVYLEKGEADLLDLFNLALGSSINEDSNKRIGPCWIHNNDVNNKEPDFYVFISNDNLSPHLTLNLRETNINFIIYQVKALINLYLKTIFFKKTNKKDIIVSLITSRLSK